MAADSVLAVLHLFALLTPSISKFPHTSDLVLKVSKTLSIRNTVKSRIMVASNNGLYLPWKKVAIIVDIVVNIDKLEGCRNMDLEVAGAAYLLDRIKKLLAAIIDPYFVD